MLMKRLNELPYFTIVAMDLLGLSSFKGLFTVCFFFGRSHIDLEVL